MPHRVLFMISSMRGGGSEQQTLLLLRHLDRDRFAPHLYVTERAGELMSRIPEDVVVHSFDDVERRTGIYFPGHVLRQQIRHLRDLLRRNSIEVIYDRTFHMTMIAGPASRGSGNRPHVPRVSTIVSPPEQALPLLETRFLGIKRNRLKRAYRQSSDVIAVSRIAAESAERYYSLQKNSVRVIYNPVDREALLASANVTVPSSDDLLNLVCVGRMTAEKGHRDLIAAVALAQSMWPEGLPRLRLWMVGDGPLRGELESQCNHAGRDVIEFLGMQSSPAPWISAADALVLPSHFEGMPNVVLEAMAVGTPVIATRAGGTIELQREEATIQWAEPRNPRSLAEAILRFAGDRAGAGQRAAAALKMVQSYHNVQAATREIEERLIQAI